MAGRPQNLTLTGPCEDTLSWKKNKSIQYKNVKEKGKKKNTEWHTGQRNHILNGKVMQGKSESKKERKINYKKIRFLYEYLNYHSGFKSLYRKTSNRRSGGVGKIFK